MSLWHCMFTGHDQVAVQNELRFAMYAMYTVKKCFAVLVLSSLWLSHELELHSQACRTEPSYYWPKVSDQYKNPSSRLALLILWWYSHQVSFRQWKARNSSGVLLQLPSLSLHLSMTMAQVTVVSTQISIIYLTCSNQGNQGHPNVKYAIRNLSLNTPSPPFSCYSIISEKIFGLELKFIFTFFIYL